MPSSSTEPVMILSIGRHKRQITGSFIVFASRENALHMPGMTDVPAGGMDKTCLLSLISHISGETGRFFC